MNAIFKKQLQKKFSTIKSIDSEKKNLILYGGKNKHILH